MSSHCIKTIEYDHGGHGPDARFLSNTGQDPLENHKVTKPTFYGGPMMSRFKSTPPSSIAKTLSELDLL